MTTRPRQIRLYKIVFTIALDRAFADRIKATTLYRWLRREHHSSNLIRLSPARDDQYTDPNQATALGPGLRLLRSATRRLPEAARWGYGIWLVLMLVSFVQARMKKHRQMVDVDVLGFTVRLDPMEFVDLSLILFPHLYDTDEVAYLQRSLKPGDVFLDIGSHIGFYSLFASRAVGPTGTVLAVEADPDTFSRLEINLRANDATNVRAVNTGVSDARGVLKFARMGYPLRAASTFLSDAPDGIEVSCEPLLDIVREHGITSIKGAKLDIEGFEYRVLKPFLRDAPPEMLPEFVIIEHHSNLVGKAGGNSITLLEEYGYHKKAVHHLNYIMVRERGMAHG
jgi:FkbM family methyltransferase